MTVPVCSTGHENRWPAEPVALELWHAGLALKGCSDHYETPLADLQGLYQDTAAFELLAEAAGDSPAYWVDASKVDQHSGGLIIGLSVLQPGSVGAEFFMTRGHLHALADRAELYYCLAGTGVMLMDTVEGESRAVPLIPGSGVHVPGNWVHRSVNVGATPLTTLFCYPVDAGQDYGLVRRAGGMRQLIVADHQRGWRAVPNPGHRGYLGVG